MVGILETVANFFQMSEGMGEAILPSFDYIFQDLHRPQPGLA